jgi:hypothetical protein
LTFDTSVVGNISTVLFLGLETEGSKLGLARIVPVVSIGVAARSAIEIVTICGVNLTLFSQVDVLLVKILAAVRFLVQNYLVIMEQHTLKNANNCLNTNIYS